MTETQKFSIDRRILKSGDGLYVPLPRQAIERWNLEKGDEVTVNVDEASVKIVPKRPAKIESISEETIEGYSAAARGVRAKVTLDSENRAIHIEFTGENKQMVDLFAQNLWRNLPVMLRLLGLGSVEEAGGDGKKLRRKKANGNRKSDRVAAKGISPS